LGVPPRHPAWAARRPRPTARSNRLSQALDLYWRSPESGGLWYKSRRLEKTICPPSGGWPYRLGVRRWRVARVPQAVPSCRANMAHVRQSRPDSGLGFQTPRPPKTRLQGPRKVDFKTRFWPWLGSGTASASGVGGASPASHKPSLRVERIRAHIRQSRPDCHIRQSRPVIEDSRCHIRQSRPSLGSGTASASGVGASPASHSGVKSPFAGP